MYGRLEVSLAVVTLGSQLVGTQPLHTAHKGALTEVGSGGMRWAFSLDGGGGGEGHVTSSHSKPALSLIFNSPSLPELMADRSTSETLRSSINRGRHDIRYSGNTLFCACAHGWPSLNYRYTVPLHVRSHQGSNLFALRPCISLSHLKRKYSLLWKWMMIWTKRKQTRTNYYAKKC